MKLARQCRANLNLWENLWGRSLGTECLFFDSCYLTNFSLIENKVIIIKIA